MDNLDFEHFKSYIMGDEGGRNLYSHLTELFMKLMSERTPNAYAELEYLSSILKQAKFTPPVEEEKLDQEPKNISQVYFIIIILYRKKLDKHGSAIFLPYFKYLLLIYNI